MLLYFRLDWAWNHALGIVAVSSEIKFQGIVAVELAQKTTGRHGELLSGVSKWVSNKQLRLKQWEEWIELRECLGYRVCCSEDEAGEKEASLLFDVTRAYCAWEGPYVITRHNPRQAQLAWAHHRFTIQPWGMEEEHLPHPIS